MLTDVCSWSCKADDELGAYGSQIDLLIARSDQAINLCEMKYARGEFVVAKAVGESPQHKVSDFRLLTKSRGALHTTIVTPYGLKQNAYSRTVQSVVAVEDLFAS